MSVNLIMFRPDGTKRKFPLHPGATTIGRKEDCNIRIPVEEVSRRHAEVVLGSDGPVLRDLGAANGTYLNNRRITEEDLEPGDQIIVGPVVFTVQIDGEPSDDEIIKIRSSTGAAGRAAKSQSKFALDDESDPIAALEALASSGDQTVITPEDDDDEDYP
jgi:pSer/pThr/pTyr-binding forkhead associated (FHA) protein